MKNIIRVLFLLFTIFMVGQTNLDYQTQEFYDDFGYEEGFKTVYEYNNNQQLTSLEHLSFDNQDLIYVNDSKVLFTYDENGNKIETLLYNWNIFGEYYYLVEKEVYIYNSNNYILQKETFFWNGEEYEPENKIIYSYNSDNKLSQYDFLSWDGTSFYIETRNIAFFDIDGVLEYFITESGEQTTDTLELDSKEVFIHDENENIIERVSYFWDIDEDEFIPEKKITYQLDSNTNLLSSIEYEYEDEFIPTLKHEYIYDLTQLQTSFTHPFLLDHTDFEDFQDFPFHNKILEKRTLRYEDEDEVFINDSRFVYHYNQTAKIKDINQNNISIYPNPTDDIIHINSKTNIHKFSLLDNTGRIIFTTTSDNMNIRSLEIGIYTLIIIDEYGNVFSKNIIKK